ncbi:Uncharacterised protein [Raoultella ornithinolytica]|nr:Uncharacterised protein [Raoultella ornithinolytica]
MLLMQAQLFFQGIQIAGRLINIILSTNHADTAGALAKQRLGYHIGPVIEFFCRLQYRLTAGLF